MSLLDNAAGLEQEKRRSTLTVAPSQFAALALNRTTSGERELLALIDFRGTPRFDSDLGHHHIPNFVLRRQAKYMGFRLAFLFSSYACQN